MTRREKVHFVVDDATISAGDLGSVVHPVWWLSTIYEGPGMYEETLRQFSRPQRLVRALHLYRYEVNNGGHEQFFSNSSGVVWRDAKEGFEAIGLPRAPVFWQSRRGVSVAIRPSIVPSGRNNSSSIIRIS